MAKSKELPFVEKVVMRPLADLIPNPKNPRIAQDEDVAALAESIKSNPRFFVVRPILLSNRTGALVIIAGERRSEAAKLLGMTEVPTILLEGLTEAQEDEIMVRDNTHAGKWDIVKLLQKWKDAPLKKWGIEATFLQKRDWGQAARISDEDTPQDPALFYRITVKVPAVFTDKRSEVIDIIKKALSDFEGTKVGVTQ